MQHNSGLSFADALDLRSFVEGSGTVIPDMAKVFSGLMVYGHQYVHLNCPDHAPKQGSVVAVTDNYFSVLGVQPHLGRFFRPEEVKEPGTEPVIVLSYKTWQKQFDADPDVVGSTVKLNTIVFTVIGVTREDFAGTDWHHHPNGFVPLTMLDKLSRLEILNRNNCMAFTMGRLQPGVSIDEARAACNVAYARLMKDNPRDYMLNNRMVLMREIHSRPNIVSGNTIHKIIAALTGMGALVLVIALFNATGLLYARSMNRERELAIRTAIGASRFQITKQILIESVLLALAAGVFGILLSKQAAALLPPLVGLTSFAGWRPLVITGFIALSAGLFSGLMPALKASGISPLVSLRKEGGGVIAGKNRLQTVLIAGQLIFSIVVLSAASLACRSAVLLANADLGFQKENLHLVSFDPSLQEYKAERTRQFCADLLEQVRALPGIESAGLTATPPFQGCALPMVQAVENPDPATEADRVPSVSVGPGYLETLGMRRVAGRTFTVQDAAEARIVAIINTVLAEKLWPGQEAVGRRINIQGKVAEVVGVVEVERHVKITDTRQPLLILPLEQRDHGTSFTLVVRTSAGAPSPMPAITGIVSKLDPELPLVYQRTMEEHIKSTALGFFRMGAILAGVQGGIALLLVCAGIFGQVSFSVARRTREIGIRIALGSSKLRVIDAVTRSVAILTAISLIIGLALACGISRLLRNLLYSAGQGDALLLAGVGAVIVASVVLACWIPVRRALRVDPMEAIRHE
jgi:predicted permease